MRAITNPDDKKLSLALDRFRLCEESEHEIREEARIDHEFRLGKQWSDDLRRRRDSQNRPCLTVNQIPQFVKQVVNEFRANMPGIAVAPSGEQADDETAEIIEGLTRNIEVRSKADSAYAKAFEDAVTGGFGYVRVVADYRDDQSFDQELYIKRVKDCFSVYFDPNVNEQDYSDAEFAFVIETLSKDEFKRRWPKAEITSANDMGAESSPDWFQDDYVRVAEYWCVEHEKKTVTLYVDQNGAKVPVYEGEDIPEGLTPFTRNGEPVSRETYKRSVCCHYISGAEILETREWAGRWIPIVPFLGDEIIVDGKRSLVGLVRNARDPQMRYNFMVSAQSEAVALAPKAPFIADAGSTENFQDMWENSNTEPYAVLYYDSQGGRVAPPVRNTVEPPIMAISQSIQQSDNDLKATTGIYGASLGQPGPEQSGKAIMARQREGDTATFNYIDNGAKAIEHVGRILVDLIPFYYDTAEVINIVKPNQQTEAVKINQLFQDKDGKVKNYDLTVGRFDVTVTTGPSYNTAKEKTWEQFTQLIQAYPPLMQFAGDLFMQQSPMQAGLGDEVSKRLHKMLPPQLQENDQNDPAQMQQQMQMLMQQHEQLTQALTAANQALESKDRELASKERIAQLQEQTKLTVKEMDVNAAAGQALLMAELQKLTQRIDHTQQFLMAAADHEAQPLPSNQPGAAPANAA
jgi:hypothetical protein